MNGICEIVNAMEIGKMPKTLNCTQKSVGKFRQIISFKIASPIKNIAQRSDKFNQALSLIENAPSSSIFKSGLRLKYPINKIIAKSRLMSVGLILIKISSPEKIVKDPNKPKIKAENKGILAILLVR